DDVSSQDTGNVDDNASASTSYTETRTGPDYDNILTSTPHTEGPFVLVVPDEILKSSTSNNPTKSIKSGKPKKNRGRSLTPIVAPIPIRASTPITPMQIDDEYCNIEECDECYLTIEKFNYTMKLLDEKITLIYRLCRRISEQQRLDSQTIQRLVVVDELSDEFWNRAYKKVSKELIPKILFPSDTEYREALEKYLAEHASHYIENLRRNTWVSLFESKLLPE
ncbi:19141_t:CDS:2, partial [Rhizophagus irregularis]